MLSILPGPVAAKDDPLVAAFAVCAGRFSAELEHAWLMRDAESRQVEARRETFLSLLDATVPPERQRRALNLRISAKAAHAALLAQANFSSEPESAREANRKARIEIASCAGYLLKS